MVCKDCEKKLSKVIVPDKWKDGARNVTGGTDGGHPAACGGRLGTVTTPQFPNYDKTSKAT